MTPRNIDGVKADPPPVFFSQIPAVLVNVDGPPIWSPIPGSDLRFAVNTNWDLFLYPEPQSYYLRVEKGWLTAGSLQGPWREADTLPASFSNLPDDGNWTEVRAALQPQTTGRPPTVFVSEKPAELLLLNGAPRYLPVTNTNLLWVSNTDADVFRVGQRGAVYYLVSGRWFSAPDFSGPWTFATPALPDNFRRIPLSHPRSRVLASVPGTRQALEAVLLAQVPQTATVNRHEISPPAVTYQGPPQFEPIENTSVARAMNTDKNILKAGDMYYMCFDGVWFVSKSASGPWTVADTIPKEIYQIPISSPAHNVTYVTVESSDDDEVTFEAAAEYTGMMVAWGTTVWGSGWYYPPYYGYGRFYPVYYPYYPSYGYGARYNPWTRAYVRGGAIYGPHGGAGYGASTPDYGTWARGAAAYGPAAGRGAVQAYNPRTGAIGTTIQGSNVYGNWGSTAVQRGDRWAQTSRVTRNPTGTTSRITQGSGGGGAFTRRGPQGNTMVGRTGAGDVYAGHDGSIYRNQGGTWQKYGDGGWSNAARPTGTSGQARDLGGQAGASRDTVTQLNSDRSARIDGAQRTGDLNRARRTAREATGPASAPAVSVAVGSEEAEAEASEAADDDDARRAVAAIDHGQRMTRRVGFPPWTIPAGYAAAALAIGFALPRLEHRLWLDAASSINSASAIAIYSTVAAGTMTLSAIVFSLTFVMVQFSATAYSPRLVLWLADDPVISHAVGLFTGTYLYSISAIAWVDRDNVDGVPFLGAVVAVMWLLASIGMFIALIRRVARLQVNKMLAFTAEQGRRVIVAHYSEPRSGAAEDGHVPPTALPAQELRHRGRPRTVQAIDTAALLKLASAANARVDVAVAIGDTLIESTPLLRVFGTGRPIEERRLLAAIQVGDQRTFEQDPQYAIRLLVDIAIRALSPAINDPTTAVQALDEIGDLLLRLGNSCLATAPICDAGGVARVVMPVPSWEDFLRLAFEEICSYGASSVQVMRRMNALLTELTAALPVARRPALGYWKHRLRASIERHFPDLDQRRDASAGDRQGLGVSRPDAA